MNRIELNEITFVVQGPIVKIKDRNCTERLIGSIRRNFPGSKIILSTWKDENTTGMSFVDKLVISEDPGAEIFLEDPVTYNNVNRQIVSTFQALQQVTTKFAIKVRSDLFFKNDLILQSLMNLEFIGRNPSYSLLCRHVVVSSQTSVDPRRQITAVFTLCDWIYAGLTSDLLEIWSIPLMPREWFRYFHKSKGNVEYRAKYLSRYFPEEYIFRTFVQKKISFVQAHSYDVNEELILLSEKILANNIVIKSNLQLGVRSQKHSKPISVLLNMYSYKSWKKLAQAEGLVVRDSQFDLVGFVLPIVRHAQFVRKIWSKISIELKKVVRVLIYKEV